MTILRPVAGVLFVLLAIYTIIVFANHGAILVQVFIADLISLTWTGQFVFDFATYLVLTALWVGWRHQFSGPGILLALLALVGGMLFFAIYLIVVAQQAKGDPAKLLLGPGRAGS